MALMRFVSWNVNGFRAVTQKPDWDWFRGSDADVVGLQETKADPSQIAADYREPAGWHSWWCSCSLRKGYSGVAVFSRGEALRADCELPDPAYQGEGRLIHLEYRDFHYFNVYFPNGGEELEKGVFKRVPYKMGFFDAFLEYAEALRRDKPIVVCGDFNIAHKAVDLARPRENEQNTGYLPVERAWLDTFTAAGYLDSFRLVHGDRPNAYSWWSYRMKARERNIGWRIDYFFVSEELRGRVKDAWIETGVHGSDHCPVGLALDMP